VSVAHVNLSRDEEIAQAGLPGKTGAVEVGRSSSGGVGARPSASYRPSFISGIGSLLDLSGAVVARDYSTRHVDILPPERMIANAWRFVGHSLREVLPADGKPASVDK